MGILIQTITQMVSFLNTRNKDYKNSKIKSPRDVHYFKLYGLAYMYAYTYVTTYLTPNCKAITAKYIKKNFLREFHKYSSYDGARRYII